ncbi:MAG: HAD family hydrolase, partial [Chloroflexi bacterium]|nr:HAD family hydrolase [Chloroflexota bacterium]
MNNLKAILFDFDYTLADSSQGVFDCVNFAFKEMSLPEKSFVEISRTIGLSLSETFFQLTGTGEMSKANVFARKFVERADQVMTENTRLFDGIEPVMKALRRHQIKTGIVSTKFRYRIIDILKRHAYLGYFDVIMGGEDVSIKKPDPTGLYMALAKLGVRVEQSLYLGDSLTDAETAKRAHIDFIAVLSGATTRGEFRPYPVREIIHSVTELPRLLNISQIGKEREFNNLPIWFGRFGTSTPIQRVQSRNNLIKPRKRSFSANNTDNER